MNNLETELEILKDLQSELNKLNTRKKQLSIKIINQSNLIDNIKAEITKPISYIARDVDLAIDFINKKKSVTSRQIIEHMNLILKNQYTRWKVLDGNTFMGTLGKYIKDQYNITYHKNDKK